MSRSGYSDDCEQWGLIRWRGAVNSAIKGKRGQAMLRELAYALDAMPVKELVANELQADGQFCALGVVGAKRGIDLAAIDPDDRHSVAQTFGIAEALAAEIMFENDEHVDDMKSVYVEICGPMRQRDRRVRCVWELDERAGSKRWSHMRAWVGSLIKENTL